MKPRNIVIINDFAHINGGAAKVALSSAVELAKNYNVYLLTAVKPISEIVQNSSIRLICLDQKDILKDKNRIRAIAQGLWNVRAYRALKKLLTDLSPKDTIIHYHGWTKALSPSILSVTSKVPHKVVFTLHDYFLCCPNGGMFNYKKQEICDITAGSIRCFVCNCDVRNYPQKIYRFIRHLIQRYYLNRHRHYSIIYISDLNKTVSKKYFKIDKTSWFYLKNPVDFTSNSYSNISDNQVYLFMGRLSAEKGVYLFCEAMRNLKLKGRILGDGYLMDSLKNKYPEIDFCGWKSGKEKDEILLQTKALVFPSLWYEGAPLTIYEMQALGIPCIVPNRCAAAEAVIDNITGFVFNTGSLPSLEDAIIRCENANLTDIQQNISASFNASDYSISTHTKHLIDIYNNIL